VQIIEHCLNIKKHNATAMATLGIEQKASRMLSGRDSIISDIIIHHLT
jgi:hypothetical protein